MALVTSSFPALSFSGFPALMRIWNPPNKMRRNAIPPPIPIAMPRIWPINNDGSVGMHPTAVHACFPSPMHVVHVSCCVPAKSQTLVAAAGFVPQHPPTLHFVMSKAISESLWLQFTFVVHVPGHDALVEQDCPKLGREFSNAPGFIPQQPYSPPMTLFVHFVTSQTILVFALLHSVIREHVPGHPSAVVQLAPACAYALVVKSKNKIARIAFLTILE